MDVSKVNETHKHHGLPPRPPFNNSAQPRQRIVEILAGTANGCLSELGYSPDMPQRLRELEYQNEQWRLENMKLYQDNVSLLELIHQHERIQDIRALDPEKNVKILELDTELQKTRTQRDELARAQLANNSTPTQLQQDFDHLQRDYSRVLMGYRAMRTEVERLQGQIRTLTVPKHLPQGPQTQTQSRYHPQHQPQQQFQQQSQPQLQQHLQSQPLHQPQPIHVQHPQSNRPTQRQSAPSTLMQPHVQQYTQQHHQLFPATSRAQPGQQINRQSPPSFVQGQKKHFSQSQQAIFEQRHQSNVQSQQPRSRQSSGSMPAPTTRSGQDSFVNMTNLQQHVVFSGELASSSRPNSNSPHSNGFGTVQSTPPAVPTMPEHFATQSRTSFSSNSGPPTPVSQQFFAPPRSNFIPDSPKIAIPPSNNVPSSSTELFNPNVSTSVPPTISPRDTYLKLVNQVRSPPVQDVQIFNTDTTNAGTSISPVNAPVASQPVNMAFGLPASIPPHQINSLKRESPARPEDHPELIDHLQKRPRLEPQLEATVEPVVDGTEDTLQMEIDEDEDVIEVGPDGLRLVEDCILDLFGEEKGEGEERYCKLCIVRRDMGYSVDPPKPFVKATNDELQAHCMTEHAEAWDTLRQSV